MNQKKVIGRQKNIAMIAHDHKKNDLVEWVQKHKSEISRHKLFATGTTGALLKKHLNISVECFESGPLGGDLEAGASITRGEVDLLIFFWDPLASQPHDPDIKALLRVAVVWNIPVACNIATADFLLTSPLMSRDYEHVVVDYASYQNRLKNQLL